MTAWEIFCQGRYLVKKNKKLWFLLWVLNVTVAAVAALPIFRVLSVELNHSLMAGSMFDRFNLDFASEFAFKYWDTMPWVLGLGIALALVYLILTLLTTSGTLAVFSSTERRFSAAVFFRGCGVYFWRFFRLFLVAAIFYGVFVLALNGLLATLANKITKNWTQEKFVLFVSWFRWLFVIFAFLVVNMIFDYAKIRLVLEERRSAIAAAYRSIKFVFRHFGKTLSVFLFCALLGLIFVAIYNPLEQILPPNSRRWVITVFFLQQLFILARVYVRLTFLSSEVLLYEDLRPVSGVAPWDQGKAALEALPVSPATDFPPPAPETLPLDPVI